MNIKIFGLAVILLLIQGQLCPSIGEDIADSAGQANLTIHLPRQATVEGTKLTLGQVAVVAGGEPFASKAREIGLGRISFPGQKVTIDRSLILSRLACSTVSECKTTLTGADKVSIRQRTKVIESESFIEAALSFVSENIKDNSIARWEPAREPAELVLPNQTQNIELVARLVARGTTGQTITEVSVIADGELAGTRQVVLRPTYNIRRIVTVTEVPAGTVITPENTRIENTISDEPEPADWATPYGLVAVRNLAAGTVVNPRMITSPQPEIVIERNQAVVIRIDRPSLAITAMGKAMEKGRIGECIKVQNTDSQRVILARVNEDGSVEPIL